MVVFDPLDGSSNIDSNGAVGTIFGVYRRTSPKNETPTINELFQKGDNIVCAGYCLYSAATQLVLTIGENVDIFTMDPNIGEFILT